HEARSVGAKGQRVDPADRVAEAARLLAGGDIVQAYHFIDARGGQHLAIRAESQAARLDCRFDLLRLGARRHVPKANRLLGAGRGERLAVESKGGTGDGLGVGFKASHVAGVVDIPQADVCSVLQRGEGLAVGSEGEGYSTTKGGDEQQPAANRV